MATPTVWLEVMAGRSPETARPVLVSRDPRILQAVADALHERVAEGAEVERDARDLMDLVRAEGAAEAEGDG